MIGRYFYKTYNSKNRKRLEPRHEKLLVSKVFLDAKCTWTLKQRAEYIKQKFPGSAVSTSAVQRLYKKKMVKYKKVIQKVTKYNPSF